jgi:hypothetical protein
VLMQSFRSSCLFFSSSSLPPASTCNHLNDTPVTVNRLGHDIAYLTYAQSLPFNGTSFVFSLPFMGSAPSSAVVVSNQSILNNTQISTPLHPNQRCEIATLNVMRLDPATQYYTILGDTRQCAGNAITGS